MNPNKKMAVLDTQMWVGKEERRVGIPEKILKPEEDFVKTSELKEVILYSFYKKEVANRIPNLANSAAPEGQKIATATKEVIRRLKNTSRDLPPEDIELIHQHTWMNSSGVGMTPNSGLKSSVLP